MFDFLANKCFQECYDLSLFFMAYKCKFYKINIPYQLIKEYYEIVESYKRVMMMYIDVFIKKFSMSYINDNTYIKSISITIKYTH